VGLASGKSKLQLQLRYLAIIGGGGIPIMRKHRTDGIRPPGKGSTIPTFNQMIQPNSHLWHLMLVNRDRGFPTIIRPSFPSPIGKPSVNICSMCKGAIRLIGFLDHRVK